VQDILLLDYSPTTRRVTRLALAKAGFNVILAETVEVGLAALRRGWPDAVLVNTDIPGMNGRALCEVIHRENADRLFPIFVVTPALDPDAPVWIESIPNCFLLEQPTSTDSIIAQVAARIAAPTLVPDTSP